MSGRSVADCRELATLPAAEPAKGRTVARINGCFDLLHVGHTRLLQATASFADLLVVAANSDRSTLAAKGVGRPVAPLSERMESLAAVSVVTLVTSFDEPTADPLLEHLRPDLHVKGTDWTPETVSERDVVAASGGRVVIAGDHKHRAASDLRTRLRRG